MLLCDNCGEAPFTKSRILPTPTQASHLREIIRSNSLPPERSSFQEIVAEVPSELSRYDDEIQRVQGILDILRSDRAILESYADECRSVFSPARRLPIELLGEIFDMCAPPDAHEIKDTTTGKGEVERLAKKYLLQLSRVCSRWHRVVMGTPMLWSTLVVDTVCWIECPAPQDALLSLITASLERGAQSPLTLEIAVIHGDSSEHPVLELISRHSRRWKSIYLWIHPGSLGFLAPVKGNLPLLKHLGIHANSEDDSEHQSGLDLFKIAPRLTHFRLIGPHFRSPTLPWEQLLDVKFENRSSHQLSGGLNILPFLSSNARYVLEVNIFSVILPVILPPVTSEISSFTVSLRATPDATYTETVFGEIFDSLTLPRLQALFLLWDPEGPALPWPEPQFSAFATRSSLHASLTSLDIQVALGDDQLLRCLQHLSSLEEMWISDYEGDHVLITDNLFNGLVWNPDDPPIAPQLRFVSMASLVHFRDDSLWEFVNSRATSSRRDKGPFEIEVFWLPGSERELTSQFVERFSDLKERGELLMLATAFAS